jgi:hypothetical protein
MGTFAATAIVVYRLSFAEQEKQTSVSVYMCLYIYRRKTEKGYIYICCRLKRKMEAHAICLNPFTDLRIVQMEVYPFVDEETMCKRTKGTKRTCPSMVVTKY